MSPPLQLLPLRAPLAALFLLVFSHPVAVAEPKEIFSWVAAQMNVETVSPPPEVRFVAREALADAFMESSRTAYLRWEEEYGAVQAEAIMSTYTAGIVGLFNADAGRIYVGNFLESCRQRAILAHEFVHYFQWLTQGPAPRGGPLADMVHVMREMEAQDIERRFAARFCERMVP